MSNFFSKILVFFQGIPKLVLILSGVGIIIIGGGGVYAAHRYQQNKAKKSVSVATVSSTSDNSAAEPIIVTSGDATTGTVATGSTTTTGSTSTTSSASSKTNSTTSTPTTSTPTTSTPATTTPASTVTSGSTTTEIVNISVWPGIGFSLAVGHSYSLQATVTGTTNRAVTWSASGGNGTVNSAGLFTATGTGHETITATSVADPSKSDAPTYDTIDASATILGIGLSPSSKTLQVGATQVFNPNVAASGGEADDDFVWSVSGGHGTIAPYTNSYTSYI